jgi:hypothetical protein
MTDNGGSEGQEVKPEEAQPVGPVVEEVVRAIKFYSSETRELLGYKPMVCRKVGGVVKSVERPAFGVRTGMQDLIYPSADEALEAFEETQPEVRIGE